jgi:hypothetical protein
MNTLHRCYGTRMITRDHIIELLPRRTLKCHNNNSSSDEFATHKTEIQNKD